MIAGACTISNGMQITSDSTSSSFQERAFANTGGFLHPETIVNGFGLSEGMKVADFGCGSGYFTIILAEKVGPKGKVYALDVMESALDTVKQKARKHGLENIEPIRSNLEVANSSSLIDNSQDIVLMANILFQSNKKGDIIKEGKRVLASGGRLIVIDWKKGTGGFGPPDNLRPDQDEIRSLAEREGLAFVGSLDAGNFHFGFIFRKQ